MRDVRRCPEDGFFEGKTCPVCGEDGPLVLPGSRRKRLSKFCSGALRHFPDDVGIAVDEGGWTDREQLVQRTAAKYDWFEPEMLDALVATDPKGRYELDEGRIRATYGHSVDVSLASMDAPVPDELYHGTAPANVDAILTEGLKPMNRQLVHLSDSVATAREVGARHAADPVVLRVDATGLLDDGWDVTKRGATVYTVERVPPDYLAFQK